MGEAKRYPTPQAGDVWEDGEKREADGSPRRVRIESVVETGVPWVNVRSTTSPRPRLSRVSTFRMRPPSFRLVERDGKPWGEEVRRG